MRATESTGVLAFPNHLKRTRDATSLQLYPTREGAATYHAYALCAYLIPLTAGRPYTDGIPPVGRYQTWLSTVAQTDVELERGVFGGLVV